MANLQPGTTGFAPPHADQAPISSSADGVVIGGNQWTKDITVMTTIHGLRSSDDMVTNTILNADWMKTLRRFHGNIILKKTRITVYQKHVGNLQSYGAIRFGLIPSGAVAAGASTLASQACNLATMTFNNIAQHMVVHEFVPTACDLNFGRRSVSCGHPVAVLLNDGYSFRASTTTPAVTYVDLCKANIEWTFELSGDGPSVEVEF